jgi:predicted pyridoxine 5'-phosphate oxidase superfamily flavin-nucleotide-binding protein
VSFSYSDSSRELQDRFDTRRIADRLDERFVQRGFIDEGDRDFIEHRDMFFLATVDAEGHPQCSYKGGDPGFVKVLDPTTLAFPNYDGNGMYLSMGNVLDTGEVGMLFIDFTGDPPRRLRINGTATIDETDPLLDLWDSPQFVVRVHAREVFPNCPRYIHRMQLVERSVYVPRDGCEPPVPAWKKSEWARDVLPSRDTGAL